MDVSIIIVNYNTFALTKAAIESVLEKTVDIRYEVIVVDNNSRDGSGLQLKDYFGEKIVYIQSDENVGFGRANNLGVKFAIGKYLFLLNSDTILLNNAVKYFWDFMENSNANKKVGVVGGVLWDINHKTNGAFGYFPKMRNILKVVIVNYLDKIGIKKQVESDAYVVFRKPFSYIDVDYVLGADMFLLSSFMKSLGGFDPYFFMYYEETDLQKRVSDKGFRRVIIEGPQIIHLECGSSIQAVQKHSTVNKQMMTDKSMFGYFKKHKPYICYLVFRFLYSILRFPIIVKYPVREQIKYVNSLFTRVELR